MANQLFVSICVPTYNAEATIRETLLSITNQTHQGLEILIVDNASTDRTLEIVETFRDARIVIHRSKTNIGAEANFTRCIKLASGPYTAIYHADDIYTPTMVKKQVAYLEKHPEAGAVFTNAMLVNEKSEVIGKYNMPHRFINVQREHLYDFQTIFKAVLLYSNFLIFPSAMVRTSIYQKEVIAWREDLFGSSADLDVWLRILNRHFIGILPEPLMHYRVSTRQGSHSLIRMRTERADLFRVIDYYFEKDEIREMLSLRDHRHYAWLNRTDRIMRAMNLVMKSRKEEARPLIADIYSRDALLAAFNSTRGFQTFLLGCFLSMIILFKADGLGVNLLTRLRGLVRR
ncbi:MAG: glycosyltransferase [Candidatus Manganitrophus sp. SA1]|nr:glycosyltransferase [Candidatus Manganitrophus morganii]